FLHVSKQCCFIFNLPNVFYSNHSIFMLCFAALLGTYILTLFHLTVLTPSI
ncbi:hypothetical protein L9F63_002462, partial [Diploptera punctata]